MTVDQCIEAYERLASKIFSEDILTKINDWARFGARYSDTVLENAIKEIVKQYAGDEDAPMRDPSENPCKVSVAIVMAYLPRLAHPNSVIVSFSQSKKTTSIIVLRRIFVPTPIRPQNGLSRITKSGRQPELRLRHRHISVL